MANFANDLRRLINQCCMENGSNTPDFILATYLLDCLDAYNKAVQDRDVWYGLDPQKGMWYGEAK